MQGHWGMHLWRLPELTYEAFPRRSTAMKTFTEITSSLTIQPTDFIIFSEKTSMTSIGLSTEKIR